MLKLKHSFLLLVVALLAACGTQAELPEAAATAEEGLSQISAAELEQAFATSELSVQNNTWDKKKYNRYILKKVVVGDPKNPPHKYLLAVVCKVPGKKHDLYAVKKYLEKDEYKYIYIPKKYKECAIYEFDYFGDKVKFKYEDGKHSKYSNVDHEGYVKAWGKKREYKASKYFHVKRGGKFTTYNKYDKKPEHKYIKFYAHKYFVEDKYYSYDYDPKDVYYVTLYCGVKKDYEAVATLELKKGNKYHDYEKVKYDDVAHKYCYTEEEYVGNEKDEHQYKLEKADFYYEKPYEEGNKHAYAEHNKAKSDKFYGEYKDIKLSIKQYMKKVEKPDDNGGDGDKVLVCNIAPENLGGLVVEVSVAVLESGAIPFPFEEIDQDEFQAGDTGCATGGDGGGDEEGGGDGDDDEEGGYGGGASS